ncbi:MAG: hypothetical protein K1X78_03465 [Verrucomicrobiaceae bacterium]|nr:hypothetical protein [Verrucomicrobiaceae bacterium]
MRYLASITGPQVTRFAKRAAVCCAALLAGIFLPLPNAILQAATSQIVGTYPVSVPAGNSAWVSGLVTADLYEGAAVTVTADFDGKALVSFSAPGWTAGAFNRHYAEPQSGTSSGLAIDILSNTTDTLKLNTTPAAAGLTNGMIFVVRKHTTLGGLMPTGGGLAVMIDSLILFGTNGLQTSYFYNGAGWTDSFGTDSNNVIVRPAQGFVIHATSPLTITVGSGEVAYVKSTATRIRANANVPNLMGALNPLGTTTTLGSLGITSSMQAFNDSLVTLTPGTLAQGGTYLSNGANLINGLGQNSTSVTLPAGASVVINVNTAKNMVLAPVPVGP